MTRESVILPELEKSWNKIGLTAEKKNINQLIYIFPAGSLH